MLYAYAIRYASRCFAYVSITYIIRIGTNTREINKCITATVDSPGSSLVTHTCIQTEKVNPFSTFPNRAGGWAFSNSFPLRGYGFKSYIKPVSPLFVMLFFLRYFSICNNIFSKRTLLCTKWLIMYII